MPDLWRWLLEPPEAERRYATSPYFHALVHAVLDAEAAGVNPMPILRDVLVSMAGQIERMAEAAVARIEREPSMLILHRAPTPPVDIDGT